MKRDVRRSERGGEEISERGVVCDARASRESIELSWLLGSIGREDGVWVEF